MVRNLAPIVYCARPFFVWALILQAITPCAINRSGNTRLTDHSPPETVPYHRLFYFLVRVRLRVIKIIAVLVLASETSIHRGTCIH